jgi:hypothetical protein
MSETIRYVKGVAFFEILRDVTLVVWSRSLGLPVHVAEILIAPQAVSKAFPRFVLPVCVML